jgi:tetratricopeptide (TPR) repeat protein
MWPFTKKDAAPSPRNDAKLARAQLLWKQGTRFLERKRFDKAIQSYEEAYELEPSRLDGRLNLGAALYLAGRPADAVSHLKYVLAFDPQNAVALLNLAATYDALGDIEQSVEALETLVKDRPNWADANYNLAVAYMKLERFEDAALALRRELTLNPKHDGARTLLNELHLKLKPRAPKTAADADVAGDNQTKSPRQKPPKPKSRNRNHQAQNPKRERRAFAANSAEALLTFRVLRLLAFSYDRTFVA